MNDHLHVSIRIWNCGCEQRDAGDSPAFGGLSLVAWRQRLLQVRVSCHEIQDYVVVTVHMLHAQQAQAVCTCGQ
jgi:hypothetical protein